MTPEDMIIEEIRQGRTKFRSIRESRPQFMRADLRLILRRLTNSGKITCEYGGHYKVVQ